MASIAHTCLGAHVEMTNVRGRIPLVKETLKLVIQEEDRGMRCHTNSQSPPPGMIVAFIPDPSMKPCVIGRMTRELPFLIVGIVREWSLERYARIVNA